MHLSFELCHIKCDYNCFKWSFALIRWPVCCHDHMNTCMHTNIVVQEIRKIRKTLRQQQQQKTAQKQCLIWFEALAWLVNDRNNTNSVALCVCFLLFFCHLFSSLQFDAKSLWKTLLARVSTSWTLVLLLLLRLSAIRNIGRVSIYNFKRLLIWHLLLFAVIRRWFFSTFLSSLFAIVVVASLQHPLLPRSPTLLALTLCHLCPLLHSFTSASHTRRPLQRETLPVVFNWLCCCSWVHVIDDFDDIGGDQIAYAHTTILPCRKMCVCMRAVSELINSFAYIIF